MPPLKMKAPKKPHYQQPTSTDRCSSCIIQYCTFTCLRVAIKRPDRILTGFWLVSVEIIIKKEERGRRKGGGKKGEKRRERKRGRREKEMNMDEVLCVVSQLLTAESCNVRYNLLNLCHIRQIFYRRRSPVC
jgi:hypothetical protein